jgi:hypothetical protein
MVDGKKVQNPYGSTESARIDGTAISTFVSWDSKITTVNAILGGDGENYVKKKMKEDGIYEEFIDIVQVSVSLLPFFPPTANAGANHGFDRENTELCSRL